METLTLSKRIGIIASLFLLITSIACGPSISTFDQHAYTQTTALKVDASNLMDRANEDYPTHEKEVKDFLTQTQKVYEYGKNRPKNEITMKMWDKLLRPDGHLLGGFISRWKSEGKLNTAFISEQKKLVEAAFDEIAGLESKKLKESDVSK